MNSIPMLWQLQLVEEKIKEISSDRNLQEIKTKLQGLKDQYNSIKKEIEKTAVQYKEWENKIGKNNTQNKNLDYTVNELQDKLYNGTVSNIKAYEKMEKELEKYKVQRGIIESEIIDLMYKKEKLEKEIKTLKKNIITIQKEYKKQKDIYCLERKKSQNRRKNLIQQREALLEKIQKPLLKEYREIEKNISQPIAKLENGLCSYCHMNQSIILLKEIKNSNEIHICENCGRILYMESNR